MVTTKNLLLTMWLGSIALILTALYMQYFMGLAPCALCMTQRVFIIAVGITALLAWLHNYARPLAHIHLRGYSFLTIIFTVIGASFSARHVWLQSLPDDLVPACGPSLGYLIETVPFSEALTVLLQGDGHCAEVSWSFLGLSIPSWTFLCFIGFFVINMFIVYREYRHPR